MDVNPIMKGQEKKLTKNKEVPIIRYERDKNVYESDPKRIIRWDFVPKIDYSHYVEDVGKQPLTSEELKWIDYIHKEVIPSMSLVTSSSLGNYKYIY